MSHLIKKKQCNKALIMIHPYLDESAHRTKKIKSLEPIKTEKIDLRTNLIKDSVGELRPNH